MPKKPKVIKSFYFNNTNQQVVDLLNKQKPINLKYNQDLIDRVHSRYSVISKTDISIIVKSVFQSFRDLLILGKVLNFNKLLFDAKLHFFTVRRNGHILPFLKVKVSTPPVLRQK